MEFLKIGDEEIEVLELWESEKARLYRRLDNNTETWIPRKALSNFKFDIENFKATRTVKDWFIQKINWK